MTEQALFDRRKRELTDQVLSMEVQGQLANGAQAFNEHLYHELCECAKASNLTVRLYENS